MTEAEKKERLGEVIVFFEIIIASLSPLLIKSSENLLTPIFFLGSSMFLAGIVFFIALILTKKLSELKNKEALHGMFFATFFIILLFFPLQFIAGQKTSPGNIAVLGLCETLFTFLFFGLLRIEKNTPKRILGAFLTSLSAAIILSKSFSGNLGIYDLIFVLATAIPPFGNYFQKKVVKIVSAKTLLCFRCLVGGSILMIFSFFFEKNQINFSEFKKVIFIIFSQGLLVFALSKLLFLESIKILDVSKVIALGGLAPAFTILFGFLFMGEIPNFNQVVGFILGFVGVLFLINKRK